jgi:hypothetical protein
MRISACLVGLLLLVAALPLSPAARAETAVVNTTAFPLPGNVLFPARTERKALRCQNAKTNNAATITYPSGFSFTIEPGGSLWETNIGIPSANVGIGPNGQILATGTAGQVLSCEETYRERFQ